MDEIIRRAIEERRLLQLTYQGKERIVEPHDYGISNGVAKLFVFQVGGSSSHPLPNWRMLFVERIETIRMLDQTFAGGRPVPSGKHQRWDQLFARVKPAPKPDRYRGAAL